MKSFVKIRDENKNLLLAIGQTFFSLDNKNISN